MDSTQTMPAAATTRSKAQDPSRFLYSGAAALLLVLMFIGFKMFYLHGKAFPDRPLAPPIRALLITHGLAMSAWMVLFVVQPLLVASRNVRIHMTLGKVGAVLAGCILLLGWRVGIAAAQVAPPEFNLWGMNARQFLAIPVISITLFAVLVAIGVWNRKRSAIHRPMMLLGTLAAIPAALDRIPALGDLYRTTIFGSIWGPFFSALVFGGLFLVVKWALTRSHDKYYTMGWTGLVVADACIMVLAKIQVWDGIAGVLMKV